MPDAPRADPYVENYSIRLLPQVKRKVVDLGKGGGFAPSAPSTPSSAQFVQGGSLSGFSAGALDASSAAPPSEIPPAIGAPLELRSTEISLAVGLEFDALVAQSVGADPAGSVASVPAVWLAVSSPLAFGGW